QLTAGTAREERVVLDPRLCPLLCCRHRWHRPLLPYSRESYALSGVYFPLESNPTYGHVDGRPTQVTRSEIMSTSTFRTAVVRTPGGPDSIEIINVPLVEPGPGKVRVAIAAAPVNPV